MEVGGQRTAGPDVGFEVDFLWYFGAGVDVRLGESFVAGAGISGIGGCYSDSRSLEAGIHLG
jgi:hypothetical protein